MWDMLQHTYLSGDVAFRQVNDALKSKICHSNSSVARIERMSTWRDPFS